jgi:hypothetical protein
VHGTIVCFGDTDRMPSLALTELRVEVQPGGDLDAREQQELGRALRRELDALEVESVEPAGPVTPPAGAKAVDALSWEVLVVSLVAGGGLVGKVVDAVRDLLVRRVENGRPPAVVKVRIGEDVCEITGPGSDQAAVLVAAFLRRHDGVAGGGS